MMQNELFTKLIPSVTLALLAFLSFSLSGCDSKANAAPSNADVVLTGTSVQNKFVVTMHPSKNPIVINQMHTWEIKLTNTAGKLIPNAKIDIGGGMPQHNHGFPTQPQVTKELSPGIYLLEGMKFSMSGWWEIKLNIEAGKSADYVTLNTIIPTEVRPASPSAPPPGKY